MTHITIEGKQSQTYRTEQSVSEKGKWVVKKVLPTGFGEWIKELGRHDTEQGAYRAMMNYLQNVHGV